MSFNANERNDDATDAIDQEVAAQERTCPDRAVLDAAQGQRDQRDDDQRVEDHSGEHRAVGCRQVHDVQSVQLRIGHGKRRRDDREVLGHVVRDTERRQRAARDQQLLADLNHLDQLGGVGVEIDHVGRLFCRLRTCIHRHAYIGLSQGWRIIGAITRHRHHTSARLLLFDQLHLGLRRGLRQEVIHTGLFGDGSSGERIVSGNHDGADAHLAQLVEARAHTTFDDIFEFDDPQHTRMSI